MAGKARTFAAGMLLVLPVGVGLGASPAQAAEVTNPSGGCWSYEPDRTLTERDDLLTAAPVSDLSTALGSWGDGTGSTRIVLQTSGATLVNSDRALLLELENGPIIDDTVATTGTATATLTIAPKSGLAPGQEPTRVRIDQPFTAPAGESVDPLTFDRGTLPIQGEGAQVVRLESVHFDVAGLLGAPGKMVVCNGQKEAQPTYAAGSTEPTGVNPATAPLAVEGVEDSFIAAKARAVAVDDVRGQSVTDAVRPGDTVDLKVGGLDSGAAYEVSFCGTACTTVGGPFTADADGRGAAEIVVPRDLPAGATAIQVVSGSVSLPPVALTVLGAPAIVATEVVGDGRVDVSLTGTSWDPKATVLVEGVAGAAATDDAAVEVEVDQRGSFLVTFTAEDAATKALRVVQQREQGFSVLSARHKLANAVPVVKEPREPKGEEDTTPPSQAPVTTPSTGTSVPSAAPVEIPLPKNAPVDVVDAPPGGEEVSGSPDVKVSEARLAGEATLAEMFGGSSRREVTFLAENVGDAVVDSPLVRLGVGRDADVEPVIVAAEVGDLQPGARVAVGVDVALPMASFGSYQVVGQVGDAESSRFSLEWQTYPWGLIALNLLGLALLAWGVWRRQQRRTRPAPALGATDDQNDSVVDLTALDQWWRTGKVAARAPVEEDNDSVVDLEAADRWWTKRSGKVS